MGRLEGKHWALIGGFIVSTFTVTAGLDHWSDVLHPAVLSGILAQLGLLIGAVFAGAPQNPNLNTIVNPGRRDSDPVPPNMGSVSDSTRRNLL